MGEGEEIVGKKSWARRKSGQGGRGGRNRRQGGNRGRGGRGGGNRGRVRRTIIPEENSEQNQANHEETLQVCVLFSFNNIVHYFYQRNYKVIMIYQRKYNVGVLLIFSTTKLILTC